jgi:hypothetical protein
MMPKSGAWLANDVLVDTPDTFNIGDSVTMNFINTTFKGTILDTGVFRGFQRCTIIGGSGKLPNYLESASYNSVPLGQIVRDIARKTDHQVSTTADQDVLNTNLVGWNILKMQASLALEKVLQITKSIWRILPDGTLWVGPEKYFPLKPDDFLVIDKFPEEARWSIYNEDKVIEPLTSLSGNNIQQVEYYINNGDLSMFVYFTLNYADSIDNLTNQNDNILYTGVYRCSVVIQKDNGLVDLTPNPSNDIIKNGFSDVPIVYPFPGMKIEVPKDTICFVQFANADPQYPRIFGWEDQTNTSNIKVRFIHDVNEMPAARKYDSVEIGQLSVTGMGVASVSFTPIVRGIPGVPVVVGPGMPVTLSGDISKGSDQVKIGG